MTDVGAESQTDAGSGDCVDLRGLPCPMPLLRTKLLLNGLRDGDEVSVLASDPGSWRDIPAWLRQAGHGLVDAGQRGPDYWFRIRKGGGV